jgi:hypothetical protein
MTHGADACTGAPHGGAPGIRPRRRVRKSAESAQTPAMPRAANNRSAGAPTLTRDQVARRLRLHADTVTSRLGDGLGSAVLAWGGRGRLMAFDAALVDRWAAAARCPAYGGKRCTCCHTILEDCEAIAAHLIATRHGFGGCGECTAPSIPEQQPCERARARYQPGGETT